MISPEPAWPSAGRYVAAVQDPAAVAPSCLAGTSPRTGVLGMPAVVAGQHAVVLPFDGPIGGIALKCFTTPPGDATRHRCHLLTQHLRRVPAPLADAAWHEEGVLVDGRWWPAVTMPWLPGTTLDLAVTARVGDGVALRRLADDIRKVVVALGVAGIAHGDLQHGNVLVEADGRVHLVDYDATWVPGCEGLAPDERGHRAYQHPARLATGAWGPWVDTVPALVIYLSVLGVAADPSLWSRGHDGENLLLTEADLLAPSTSAMVAMLTSSADRRVRDLAALLVRCCASPPEALGTLGGLLESMGPGGQPGRAMDVPAPGKVPEWMPTAGDAATAVDDGWPTAVDGSAPPPEADFDWSPTRRRRWSRRR